MKIRYTDLSHPVFVINGKSGNEYHFDFINLTKPRLFRKLRSLDGFTLYLLVSYVKDNRPLLLGYGQKVFRKLAFNENFDTAVFQMKSPEYFLYIQYFDNQEYSDVLKDILSGDIFLSGE